MGKNDAGELGLGDNKNINIPTQVYLNYEPIEKCIKAKSVHCGRYHS
jgi:hypothetical protein